MHDHLRPHGSAAALIAIFACLIVGGCTPWPPIATGGGAERHGIAWQAQRDIEWRYANVLKHGGEQWAPAKLHEARELLIRSRREHASDLHLDAAASLDAAAKLIAGVEAIVARRPSSTGNR